MQRTTTLRACLDIDTSLKNPATTATLNRNKTTLSSAEPRKNIHKIFNEKRNLQLERRTSQPRDASRSYCRQKASLAEEHRKVDNHLSTIADPLWRRICQDIVEMMGPDSALKIWKSKLGELSPQNKILIISCDDEETAAFVQQYDFIILGSLQKYFPALKQLNARAL